MKIYSHDGPVLEFNRIVASHWKASTCAKTEKKARCNLAYKFKMETGRTARSSITIPGKLSIEGED